MTAAPPVADGVPDLFELARLFAWHQDVGPVVAATRLRSLADRLFGCHPDDLNDQQCEALARHIRNGDVTAAAHETLTPPPPPEGPTTMTVTATPTRNGKARYALETPDGDRLSEHATRSAAEGARKRKPELRAKLVELTPDKPVKVKPPEAPPEASPASRPEPSASGELLDLDPALIDPSPYQMRKVFDPAELQKLADSLKADGQLQNAVVRVSPSAGGRYELIAGERRCRAARLAGVKLRCAVLEADDKRAVELAGMENFARAELNPVEEASWFRAMLDTAGYTQAALAKRLSISQPKVAQRLGLLELPEAWRERIITGVIPATWARELAVAARYPAAIDDLEKGIAKGGIDFGDMTPGRFRREVHGAVAELGRPASGWFYGLRERPDGRSPSGEVAFVLTKKRRTELDIVKLDLYSGDKEFAMNVDAWERLQSAGEDREAKKAAERQRERDALKQARSEADAMVDADEAAPKRGKGKAKRKGKADAALVKLQEALAEHADAWLRRRVAERVAEDDLLTLRVWLVFPSAMSQAVERAIFERHGFGWPRVEMWQRDFESELWKLLSDGEGHPLANLLSDLASSAVLLQLGGLEVSAIAATAGVDFRRDWRLSNADAVDAEAGLEGDGRAWLGLHTPLQLDALIEAWGLGDRVDRGDGGDLIDQLVTLAADKPWPYERGDAAPGNDDEGGAA